MLARAESVPLSGLDLGKMEQEYGNPGINVSVDRKPLNIGGQPYTSGVGTHAASQLWVDLKKTATRFTAFVGVDAEKSKEGRVDFPVKGDGKLLWSSGVMRGGDPAKAVDVDLRGVGLLVLTNDCDMLVVGQVGWGHPHPTKLSPDEQYTHISLYCLLGAPLLIGCDLEKLDPFTLGPLTNDEVLEVNQDALCRQGTCVARHDNLAVYAKPMADGSVAVGLFNRGDDEAAVTARWSDLKIAGKCRVRNLWSQQDAGNFDNAFTARVSRHGAVLVRLFPTP